MRIPLLTKAWWNVQTEIISIKKAAKAAETKCSKWDAFGLFQTTRFVLHHLLKEHNDPASMAMAVFFGVLVGTTPFLGFHLLICLAIAGTFRLNKIAMYAAAHVSTPPLGPLLLLANYEVGYFLWKRELAPISLKTLEEQGINAFGYLVVGSFIVGSALGLVAGLVAYVLLKRMKRKQHANRAEALAFQELTQDLFQAFRDQGRGYAYFARGKIRGDPAYRDVLTQLQPQVSTLDVGGGQGFLSLLLAKKFHGQAKRTVIDWDQRKITAGQKAAQKLGCNVEFVQGDVHAIEELPKHDCLLCIDVLHYTKADKQDALLEKMSRALTPGGRIFIRDIDGGLRFRRWTTYLQERASLALNLTIASSVYPRPAKEIAAKLTGLGLIVEVKPCWQGTIFGNVLIIATKPI